ncbi:MULTISPECIES: DUF2336 domain-containing protein [unclassified Methylobacterium]|uniref:DUF2336 domain-containing protein n=1 Tax=unclassified Methylobacterium TaxID=2615210 RepID=UPI0003664DBE|nr:MULTISPECIES: DUF2336 domain-containing protein [unclassified Methylobacterium]KQP37745.1 hypothetical protein ASF34_16840 [Methylobacterium sp. Leaf106]
MIIRQFLSWTRDASIDRRAEAAAALTRAYLYGGLDAGAARDARSAILALLDDPAPAVRRALAQACAGCATAPRPLVVALAGDQPDIAALVLRRSSVLTDADLVDGIAVGCETTRTAIAGRLGLSHAVSGAMAEIGGVPSLTALVRNRSAGITTGSLLRMVERHGDDAGLRNALTIRADLPLEVRQAVTARVAASLSAFAVASGWLTPARGERASREALERSTLEVSAGADGADLARLVSHLRIRGQLNAGLILRAILSGRMAFAEAALSDLTGLKADRVAGLMHDPSASGFAALHRRAGLPAVLLPAFVAALSAWREAGLQAEPGQARPGSATLSRRMIERALTACETMPLAEAQSVMALLARYEAEAAREESRVAAKAMEAKASRETRTRMQILDVEWRLAQQLVSQRPAQPTPLALQPIRIDTVVERGRTVEAVLDSLSDGLMASVREARAQVRPLAAAPIDLTGHDLVTIDVPSIVVSQPEFDVVPDPVRIDVGMSPTREVDAVLDAIPDALIASYRADRDRMRLAA